MTEEKPEDKYVRDRWHQRSMPGLFFGLLLVLLGVIFFLAAQDLMAWGDWWKYLIAGLGGIFVIEALVRYARPAPRRPRFGRLIFGIILIGVGLAFIVGWGSWWPLILIIVGLAILLNTWLRRR
jgi:peptidoglycan/LPS O-acetylase OafA/YrhL